MYHARTISFRTLLHQLARAMGMRPEDVDTQRAEDWAYTLTEAYRLVYEHHPWPESLVVEVREAQDHVFPYTNWAVGIKTMDTILSVWDSNPLTNDAAVRLRWVLGTTGVMLVDSDATSAWFVYRPGSPHFSATSYDEDTTYVDGDSFYNSATGHCQVVVDPTDDPEDWPELPVLDILARPTVVLAKGMLKGEEEGNTEAEIIAKRDAQNLADLQIAKIQTVMGQSRYIQISTPYDS